MQRESTNEVVPSALSVNEQLNASSLFDEEDGLVDAEPISVDIQHQHDDFNDEPTPPPLLPSQRKFRNHIAKINAQIVAETSDDKSVQLPSSHDILSPFSINKKSFNKMPNPVSLGAPQIPGYAREKRTRVDVKNRPDPNLNYFEMYQQLQNRYEILLADNLKQKELFKLRQETFMKREKRSKEKQDELASKLKKANTVRGDSREQMDQLHTLKKMIQNKIQKMKGETQKQLEERQEQYQRYMDELIQEYKHQLTEERKKNSTGVKEWNEKSRNLKENLKKATIKAVELDEHNNQLLKENQKLKIQFNAQQDDRDYLARINAKLKRENDKLREEIRELESELDNHKVLSNHIGSHSVHYPETFSPKSVTKEFLGTSQNEELEVNLSNEYAERERRMMETVSRLKKMLDQERKTSKALKNAHLSALSERTELEIFLNQCIEDVRQDLIRHQFILRSGSPNPQVDTIQLHDFTIRDRQKVVDILLSKERVLKLMYQKAFPTKPIAVLDGTGSTLEDDNRLTNGADRSLILSNTTPPVFGRREPP